MLVGNLETGQSLSDNTKDYENILLGAVVVTAVPSSTQELRSISPGVTTLAERTIPTWPAISVYSCKV
jgi:hypothetical protein